MELSIEEIRKQKREYMRAYYHEHPEKCRAIAKKAKAKYYLANKEKLLAAGRRSYHENLNVSRENARRWGKAARIRDPERQKAATKRWIASHREEHLAAKKARYRENLEANRAERRAAAKGAYYKDVVASRLKARCRYHNRGGYDPVRGQSEVTRVRNRRQKAIRQAAGEYTPEIEQAVYDGNVQRFGKLTCYLCLISTTRVDANIEHKTPPNRKGNNELSNLDVAHWWCNLKKGNRTYEECLEQKLFENREGA